MASFTWTQLIIGNVISGVIAAFIGAASAYFFQRKLYRRNAQGEVIKSACISIDSCVDKAVEYWSSDTTESNREDKHTLARDIHQLLSACSTRIDLVKEWKLVPDHQALDVMFHQLYSRSTGGQFEGSDQKRDPEVVRNLRSVSGRLTNQLNQFVVR